MKNVLFYETTNKGTIAGEIQFYFFNAKNQTMENITPRLTLIIKDLKDKCGFSVKKDKLYYNTYVGSKYSIEKLFNKEVPALKKNSELNAQYIKELSELDIKPIIRN